ncbi:MAG TPA: hypothetical protein VFI73_12425 [Candidatus Nitrosopolaris sp.]|nr:hypothetical protein [Candidatus Nitrosopolaris sp.]
MLHIGIIAVFLSIVVLLLYPSHVYAVVTTTQHDCIRQVVSTAINLEQASTSLNTMMQKQDNSTITNHEITHIVNEIENCLNQNQNQKGQQTNITGITQFAVINDNGLYKVRFSLNDQDDALVSSDAHIHFTMCCITTASQTPADITNAYDSNQTITADQFHDITLVLTGAKLLAYSWQINSNTVNGSPHIAHIEVSLPNGKLLTARTDIL